MKQKLLVFTEQKGVHKGLLMGHNLGQFNPDRTLTFILLKIYFSCILHLKTQVSLKLIYSTESLTQKLRMHFSSSAALRILITLRTPDMFESWDSHTEPAALREKLN